MADKTPAQYLNFGAQEQIRVVFTLTSQNSDITTLNTRCNSFVDMTNNENDED